MKKKKASEPGLLASDSDWHNNTCLNYMPDHGTAYTEEEVIKALHQADERATDFRYARRNNGTRRLEGIHYVNTRHFGEKMGEASDLLDGVDNGLRYLLDCKDEWNQILDSF